MGIEVEIIFWCIIFRNGNKLRDCISYFLAVGMWIIKDLILATNNFHLAKASFG